MSKISLQRFADEIVAPEYRQILKTAETCVDELGWISPDEPTCCGTRVRVQSFIGSPYYAECEACKKFMWNVTAPRFGNGWVTTPDSSIVDTDTDKEWICGVQHEAQS